MSGLLSNSVRRCELTAARLRAAARSSGPPSTETQETPIIGILSQPLGPLHPEMEGHTYFPASYAQYAAMSGARVVAVLCDTPKPELRKLYESINGLVVPGGKQELGAGHMFYDAVDLFTEWAMEDFDKSQEVFPIHFTCLGLEAIIMKVDGHGDSMSEFEGASGVADVLKWQPGARESWSLKFVTSDIRDAAEREPVTYEAHVVGVWTDDFWKSERLTAFFNLLSITPDKTGRDYISIIEAKRYPFVAVQFHPEQPCFEFHNPEVPHSTNAVRLSQALSLAFAQKARDSTHKFDSKDDLMKTLLYNHTPRPGLGVFDQLYTFEYQKQDKNDTS